LIAPGAISISPVCKSRLSRDNSKVDDWENRLILSTSDESFFEKPTIYVLEFEFDCEIDFNFGISLVSIFASSN
jgi:hypothetical protein